MAQPQRFWPDVAAVNRVVRTARGDVEFAEAGEGLPILYFHGTGAGNDIVFPIEHTLLDDGFRLIVPHRPGYYATPIDAGRTPADCADLFAALLDSLGIERVVVMATSGSGVPAASFAARHPQRTAGLILQCAQAHRWDDPSWLPAESRWLFPYLRNPRWRGLLHRFYFLGVRSQRWFAKGLFKAMCGPRLSEVGDSPEMHELCRMLIDSSIRCLSQTAGTRADTDVLFDDEGIQPGRISCPTLITHDRLASRVPVAHADWAATCIPQAQRCEVEAGGHLIWVGREAPRMHQQRVEFSRKCFGSA